jgi:hypothetical protein
MNELLRKLLALRYAIDDAREKANDYGFDSYVEKLNEIERMERALFDEVAEQSRRDFEQDHPKEPRV